MRTPAGIYDCPCLASAPGSAQTPAVPYGLHGHPTHGGPDPCPPHSIGTLITAAEFASPCVFPAEQRHPFLAVGPPILGIGLARATSPSPLDGCMDRHMRRLSSTTRTLGGHLQMRSEAALTELAADRHVRQDPLKGYI